MQKLDKEMAMWLFIETRVYKWLVHPHPHLRLQSCKIICLSLKNYIHDKLWNTEVICFDWYDQFHLNEKEHFHKLHVQIKMGEMLKCNLQTLIYLYITFCTIVTIYMQISSVNWQMYCWGLIFNDMQIHIRYWLLKRLFV